MKLNLHRFFIQISLCILSLQSLAQPAKYKTVEIIKTFYSNYDVSSLEHPRIELEKRNSSWYVCKLVIKNDKIEKSSCELYFDAKAGKFLELDFPKLHPDSTDKFKDHVKEFEEYQGYYYDVQPSYGYKGWYWDVINDYNKKPNLSDDELYSLARAYSSAATACLGQQFGDALEKDLFHAPLKLNSLTEKQVDHFLALGKKTVALFKEIAKRNPSFETRVGDIKQKAANEQMVLYHNIMVYAPKYLYKIVLPANLYPADSLSRLKASLKACPSNAILLSYGDNDFYPVMYLQAKGLRRDVYLINSSLLGVDRYIFRATHPQFAAKPIALSLDTNDYKSDANNYLVIEKGEKIINSYEFTNIMKAKKGKLPSNKLGIEGEYKKVEEGSIGVGYILELSGNYVVKDELILLDVINNLKGRKFCFPNRFSDRLNDLNKFIKWNGYVFVYDN